MKRIAKYVVFLNAFIADTTLKKIQIKAFLAGLQKSY